MKSYFDISKQINEDIDPYSPQALGRKRNTMLRALSLDDSGFERWVHDRIVRFSERNGVPLQQLDPSMFDSAFSEWDSHFQQNDPKYSESKQDVDRYFKRFMAVAPGILSRYQAGESAPVEEPLSPTMLDAESGDQQSAQAEQQSQRISYGKPDEPQTKEELQSSQRGVMSVLDMISNVAVNKTDQQKASTRAQINADIRMIAQDIAAKNNLDAPEQITYDMMSSYVDDLIDGVSSNFSDIDGLSDDDLEEYKNLLLKGFADQYGLVIPQDDIDRMARERTEKQLAQEAIDPSFVSKIDPLSAEYGILHGLSESGFGIEGLNQNQKNKIQKMDDRTKMYYRIQAESLVQKYSFLEGASFSMQGNKRGKLSREWSEKGSTAPSSKTSKSDVVATLADGVYVKYDEERGEILLFNFPYIIQAEETKMFTIPLSSYLGLIVIHCIAVSQKIIKNRNGTSIFIHFCFQWISCFIIHVDGK